MFHGYFVRSFDSLFWNGNGEGVGIPGCLAGQSQVGGRWVSQHALQVSPGGVWSRGGVVGGVKGGLSFICY